jgi:hypothetical protein
MELKRGGRLMSTKPTKEWITDVINKAPVCKTSYEVMCADTLIPFGEAVECVKYKHLKINWHCEDNLVGEELPACTICKKGITYSGLPIHIARIFVAYCGWVKGMTLDKDYLSCLFVGEFNPDIKELLSAIFSIGEKSNISDEFISFAKAHKIELVSAVDIVLSE